MSGRRRPWVRLYALGSLVVLGALAALTALVVGQQGAHAHAVAEALHHEDIRTALWRMETRVAGLLALTTSRAALVSQEPGSYAANWIDLGQNGLNPAALPPEDVQRQAVAAADEAYLLACAMVPGAPAGEAGAPPDTGAPQAWTNPLQQNIANRGVQRSVDEFARRAETNFSNTQIARTNGDPGAAPEFCVGPLASVWDRSGDTLELQLARRIEGANGASHESYRLDWDELARLLLAEISDLFPTAQLLPIEAHEPPREGAERAQRLAAIPARLVVPPPRPAEDLPRGYLWTLGGAWAALCSALAIGGFALRSSYAYGDKHRRFTHAVTHELRTPLTTFRMYSEMLARGMVPAASQPEYLATLEAESSRLARLVDNVLRYARLEDGKQGAPRQALDASALVERCVPELARTCAQSSARLELIDELDGRLTVTTDPDAVLQVLSNLVENACKYGRPPGLEAAVRAGDQGQREVQDGELEPDAAPIVLRVSCTERGLALDVCDAGPGVPAVVATSIFEPFDRGGRDSSDRAPGVGLGLALARALAQELGGTLELLPTARGATFRLTLPTA